MRLAKGTENLCRPPSPKTPHPVSGSACPVGALLGLGSTWLPFPLGIARGVSPSRVQRPLSCLHWESWFQDLVTREAELQG
ncbi:hypothetical protein ACRRTK_007637 [Alexandromys fortis]